jgi:integrase
MLIGAVFLATLECYGWPPMLVKQFFIKSYWQDFHRSFRMGAMFPWLSRRACPSDAVLRELLENLADHCRSHRHIYGLRNNLQPFVSKFPRLEKAAVAEIAAYLRTLGVGHRRRDNVRNSIVQLYRFARSREYLPDKRTAAEKVDRIKPCHDVATWTIEEAKLLLEHASDRWRPLIAIGLFAGLRTSEILRLVWDAVKFEQRIIAVPHRVTKTKTSRIVPIQENLFAWLEPYRGRVGLLYPGKLKTNENARSVEMTRIRILTGLPRKNNAARHSYGSFRLAVTKNYQQVSFELGNSPSMIREHYNDPQPETLGAAYFAIYPPSLDNVVPMPLALEFR